ncbi:uncharacterized protein [Parasteatoda tepidariorum]|uniref:uncharacterized protein n=1 Tax=Parasteatoda tepidariorum TaxID=114398 RepID=UPI00077FCCFB|nr:uncharacterized protein LOC107438075 [Parasteatoda tepidariorum]
MESFNETFEKAIEFLSMIQTVCERRRSQVEQLNLNYYTIYLKDRKEEVKLRKERESQKKCDLKKIETEEEKAEIDGLEVLALADLVLQKAQVIRSKSKFSSQLLSTLTTTSSESILCNEKQNTTTMKMTITADSQNHMALLRCNSAPNAFTSKLRRGLQSKSVNDFTSKTEPCTSSSISNSKKHPTAQTLFRQKNTLLNSNVGCISSKNFKDLKCLTVNSSLNQHKRKDKSSIKGETNSSGASENPHHHPPPLTYQSFKQDLTKKCCLKSNFQFPSSGFWYSFINFKNKESLMGLSKCNSTENFRRVVNLMFEIQEMMMWIDLLSFIGDEIFPSLKFLKKSDKNVVRLCSYLSSIYHESLQRKPMLNFD